MVVADVKCSQAAWQTVPNFTDVLATWQTLWTCHICTVLLYCMSASPSLLFYYAFLLFYLFILVCILCVPAAIEA